MLNYRKIEASDDKKIAGIIRSNLEKLHLNIPGTAYFDPELEHLSTYYHSDPARRVYFVAVDEGGAVIGGAAKTLSGRFRQRKGLRKRPDADSRGLGAVCRL